MERVLWGLNEAFRETIGDRVIGSREDVSRTHCQRELLEGIRNKLRSIIRNNYQEQALSDVLSIVVDRISKASGHLECACNCTRHIEC